MFFVHPSRVGAHFPQESGSGASFRCIFQSVMVTFRLPASGEESTRRGRAHGLRTCFILELGSEKMHMSRNHIILQHRMDFR